MVLFRKGLPLWIYVVIAVLPIVLVVGNFSIGIIQIQYYKEFIRELNESVVYGMENDSFRAECKGVSTRVTPGNADLIFQKISSRDYINYRNEEMGEEFIFLDFGNDTKMWLYQNSELSLIIRYVPSNAKEKIFITKRPARLVTYENLVSTEWGNFLWNEN